MKVVSELAVVDRVIDEEIAGRTQLLAALERYEKVKEVATAHADSIATKEAAVRAHFESTVRSPSLSVVPSRTATPAASPASPVAPADDLMDVQWSSSDDEEMLIPGL